MAFLPFLKKDSRLRACSLVGLSVLVSPAHATFVRHLRSGASAKPADSILVTI
jgi:hypothetical protein